MSALDIPVSLEEAVGHFAANEPERAAVARKMLAALQRDSETLHRLQADYERASREMQAKFCDNLRVWRNAIDAASERDEWWIQTVRDIDRVFLLISKSCLLDRLIYRGEKLRTRMCPVHKGHWAGLPSEPPACGCGLTGWLPEVPS